MGSIILCRPGTTERGCLFQGLSDSPSVGRAQCLRFARETWCLGGVARCPEGESGAGLPQQLRGTTGTFRLPGVAETRHRSGVGRRPRALFYSGTPQFLLPCVGENAPEDGVAGAGRARFACLAWQKRGTEAESGGAPGPGFIPGLRYLWYPAWVRMHLRTESWCLGSD